MAVGKPLKKNFYSGGSQDIEMPPLDQTPPIAQSQDPWTPQGQGENNQVIQVPDEVPSEVEQELEVEDEQGYEKEDNQEAQVAQGPKVSGNPGKTKEENFRAIREAKERAERERDILLDKMIEMQKSQKSNQQQQEPQQEESDDFDFSVEDDALLEGKHAKKIVAQMKKMQEKLKNYQDYSYQSSVEAKIKSQFPDFEDVVSEENVSVLNQDFPELAASLRDTSDIYNKAAAAYKVIKGMGIYKDRNEFMKDRDKAVKNSQKPRPVASVNPQQGDSPLSKANAFANGLTPELQKQLREEMYRARKNH